MHFVLKFVGGMALVLASVLCQAQDDLLKPFVLASKTPAEIAQKIEATKAALSSAGFTLLGSYTPYADTTVLAVTNDELRATASKSTNGGFGAAMRVALVKVHDQVQVSYTNPAYWANAYRLVSNLKPVADKLQSALGNVGEFGAKGLTAGQLRKYHYTVGMEYFDEPSKLAEYDSHEDAVKAVEAGLAVGKQGVTKVYRVDVPGKKEVLFGVAMKGDAAHKNMDDKYLMSEIDFRDIKSAAHLPYDILVADKQVLALYARFRIAISFPDLSMMGSNSFMNIMQSPEAIRKALALTVGGKE